MGALDRSKAYSGNPQAPDGQKVPNVTPDPETGIGKWSMEEIETLLATGKAPFGDIKSGMAEVVKGTAKLSAGDRHAIAVYIKSLPAIYTPKKPSS